MRRVIRGPGKAGIQSSFKLSTWEVTVNSGTIQRLGLLLGVLLAKSPPPSEYADPKSYFHLLVGTVNIFWTSSVS